MTKKYFNYQGAPWQIIETTKPLGVTLDPEVLDLLKRLRPKK